MNRKTLLATALLLLGPVQAQEIRYEIEFLDRAAIESPNVALPTGGTIDGGWITISRNGRYVAGFVRDDQNPSASRLAYRLDRDTGAVDLFEEFRFGSRFGVWVNDFGHLLAYTTPATQTEIVFWSETTGAVSFGPSTPVGTPRGFTRIFNNHDDVLLRPLPWSDEFGPTGGILWNPVLGTQVDVPFSSEEVGDQGSVVGSIGAGNDAFGFVWDVAGGAVALASPSGDSTAAHGINDSGVIVGERRDFGVPIRAVLWPDAATDPIELPCLEPVPGLVIECAATHVDVSGRVYGGGSFDDGEPLVQLVWDGDTAYEIDDLLLDPDAFCGFTQVTDLGELAGWCTILDPDLPWPDSLVRAGPAILHPVFPGLRVTVTAPQADSVVPEGPVQVEGTASDDGRIVSVTVDGIEASLVPTGNPDDPAEVSFAASFLLCAGPRTLLVVATDDEGNSVAERVAVNVVPGETSCDGGPPELDCTFAVASPSTLWPPNHKLEPIEIVGVATADGSDATIQVTAIRQDEPVDGTGDGSSAPDAFVDDAGGVSVRRERSGLGDGRIYEIEFEATDGSSSCDGSVTVGVPHDRGAGGQPVDSGVRYDSMTPGQ